MTDNAVPPGMSNLQKRPLWTSAHKALCKIQQTLEWEACREDSALFQCAAAAYEEALAAEELGSSSEDEDIDDSEAEDESESSDASYESSFVTDTSETNPDSDSEREWRPSKRACPDAPTNDECPVAVVNENSITITGDSDQIVVPDDTAAMQIAPVSPLLDTSVEFVPECVRELDNYFM